MKFDYQQGLIWIPIEMSYEKRVVLIERCIIDTGSATTAFDIDLIPFNYQKPAFIRRLCGVGGGMQEVICQTIDSLSIDKAVLAQVDIEFGDISSRFGINGFIGNDILSLFSLTIDFLRQEIEMRIQE